MTLHFDDPERRAVIVGEYGPEKFADMMRDLADPSRIARTNEVVIPNFLRRARGKLRERPAGEPLQPRSRADLRAA